MNYSSRVLVDFGNAAKDYNEHASLQKDISKRLFEHSGFIIDKKSTILDGGCGTGFLKDMLSQQYKQLTQMDLAKQMCEIAAQNTSGKNIKTIQGNLESMPFADNEFSHFFSSMALQWVDNFQKTLTEVNRVLKNDSQYAFSVPADGSLVELKESFAVLDNKPHINDFITREQLVNVMNKAGLANFEIIEEKITATHKNVFDLMHSIKKIGANYKNNSFKSFPGKNYFVRLNQAYIKNFDSNKGIPASWLIFYVVGKTSK